MKLPIEYVEKRKKYILFKNDCGVTDMARKGGIYEHYIFDYIRDNIDIKGKNIIDVGANFGFHTLEFADLVEDGNVYSFEPQKLVYYQLCGNVIINGYGNVTAYNVAISDEDTTLKMENLDYYSNDTINIGNAHLNAFTTSFNMVDVKPLDFYNFENVAVLKIDVQGYEPNVLDGAIETIKRNRPIIFVEVELAQLQIYGWSEKDIFDRLDKFGYTYKKVLNAEHLVDYVAIPIESQKLDSQIINENEYADAHIIGDNDYIFNSYDGLHNYNIMLPIPNQKNNYLSNRINTQLTIGCKSSWSITINTKYTNLERCLSLSLGESANFIFDGEKWIITETENLTIPKIINRNYFNNSNKSTGGKVSFVCTTYRRFYCVKRIVAQYLAQTYYNKELIIFNTDMEHPYELGFEDESIKIINNDTDYLTNLPYTNRGDICRDAVVHATGDYFMLADDDDIYLPWHLQQAVDGIEELKSDAWKPEKSFFSSPGRVELSMNTLEASVIVKMNRIREIGFRNDITGYEGLSWYTKLRDERQLNEHNKNYIPSYCFNWSDPSEIAGHKQSGQIGSLNNFENHKLASRDFVTEKLTSISESELNICYQKYFDYLNNNKDIFNQQYFNKYFDIYK